MLTSVLKWSEGLSNQVSIIIRRYIDHIKFAAYMAVLLLHSFLFFWFYFILLYIWFYVLFLFNCVYYVFFLLHLCTLIVMFMDSYCYV